MISDNIFIIAEAGVNHNGELSKALELVDIAKFSGANAVKFQTWKTENIISPDCNLADYQKDGKEENQYEMLKSLELSYQDFEIIKNYCDQSGIIFLSTPDDIESAYFLNKLQDIFKIGSGELTNIIYLEQIAQFKKPVILSTGMGNREEINSAVNALISGGLSHNQIHLLHAVSAYPTPDEDINISAITTLQKFFPQLKVGFSDHTLGNTAAVMAVAQRAHIIEKHFTINKDMPGPDHKASLAPDELKEFVKEVRRAEVMIGDGKKQAMPSEQVNINVVRKKLYSSETISAGDIFTKDSFLCLRGNTGINANNIYKLIGKAAKQSYTAGESISNLEFE